MPLLNATTVANEMPKVYSTAHTHSLTPKQAHTHTGAHTHIHTRTHTHKLAQVLAQTPTCSVCFTERKARPLALSLSAPKTISKGWFACAYTNTLNNHAC